MSKISAIVVGSTGNVGQLLAPFWESTGASILLQYRGTAPVTNTDHLIMWDPNEGPNALKHWISANELPSCMIILAGVTPRSGKDLFLNAKIISNCLEACKNLSIPRVLVASSSAVYGNYLDRPFSEYDVPRPINNYGKSKLEMEKVCMHWSNQSLQVTSLRIGNIAGADALLMQALQSGFTDLFIDQYDDGGTPQRSYIGPKTLADTLIKLANYSDSLPRVLNVGASVPVEMGLLANAAGLTWSKKVAKSPRSQRIILDCTRLWGIIPEPLGAANPVDIVMQLNLQRAKE